jgi:hypothetical protein
MLGVSSRECAKEKFLLQRFAMLGHVEAFHFGLDVDAQRCEGRDQLEEYKCSDGRPGERDRDAIKLNEDLRRVAFEQPGDIPDGMGRENPTSNVPVAPPMPCTPKTSSESS